MTKNVMKLTGLALVLTMIFAVAGLAQSHPVEGTYAVTSSSAEMGTLNFSMMLKKDGDKWVGEIKDSPTPLSVTSATVDADNKVTINADAGGTTVVIIGKYMDGKISGDWTAGDLKGQWTGTKKDAMMAASKPAASAAMGTSTSSTTTSVAAAKAVEMGLEGTYDFKVIADGQGEIPMTLIIKRTGDKLMTEVPGDGDLKVVAIETADPDVVNLTATYQGNGPIPLKGKRTGDEMGGKWEFGGFAGTWTAKKK